MIFENGLNPLILILDVVVCTFALRIIFGWLLNYPRLVRLLCTLAVFAILAVLVRGLNLPFAGLFVTYVLIPVIVVSLLAYLPDLTRIYRAASRGMLFQQGPSTQSEFIPELASTLHEMARLRRGAILVFRGKESLGELIGGGEPVSAKLNQSLLLSIFEPHCPRHDGAAVLEGDQIVRIGAVLPLASAEGRERRLGTRHLAALGLAQQCDADVLVVSEERGTVSHVRQEGIEELPAGNLQDLRQALYAGFDLKPDDPAGGRNSTRDRLLWAGAFVISLAASLGISAVKFQDDPATPEVMVSVAGSIRLANVPEHLYVADIDPARVDVWLNQPEGLQLDDALTVTVDAGAWDASRQKVDLAAEMLGGLPESVSVSRFEPSAISVELAEARQQSLRLVMPKFEEGGFTLESAELEPETIEVVVRDPDWNAKRLQPAPVDLGQFEEAGSHRVELRLDLPASVELAPGQETPTVLLTLDRAEAGSLPEAE